MAKFLFNIIFLRNLVLCKMRFDYILVKPKALYHMYNYTKNENRNPGYS